MTDSLDTILWNNTMRDPNSLIPDVNVRFNRAIKQFNSSYDIIHQEINNSIDKIKNRQYKFQATLNRGYEN